MVYATKKENAAFSTGDKEEKLEQNGALLLYYYYVNQVLQFFAQIILVCKKPFE